MSKQQGRRIAHALVSNDPTKQAEARAALSKAPPSVSDPTARALARMIRTGGEPAEAACRVLADTETRWFGGSGYIKLMMALTRLTERSDSLGQSARAAFQVILRGPDPEYDEKRINSRPPASTNVALRMLSVAKSVWVIGVYSMVLLVGIAAIGSGADPIAVVALLVAVFLLFTIIDAVRRRCPSCHTLLAGERLSITGNNYGRVFEWRCVSCKHRWQKQSYS